MRVTDVSGYALSSPIDPPQDRRFHGGVRRLLKRDVVLVVVETADGERGFAPAGASSSAMREYFEGDSQATFADVVEGPIADALEGETIDEITDAHDLIDALDVPERVRHEAVSAIDIALYDLRGKEVGAPIYELLCETYGTDPDTSLPMYASAGMYMEPEGYAEQAAVIDDLGFFGYKYRPGIGPAGDRRTVELLADALDTAELMLDGHTWWKLEAGTYTPSVVADLVEHAGEHGAYWVEEPVAPDDYDGYVDLAERGVPLAGGESEESPGGLIALGETGAVDFLQGDVRHHRGYTGCGEAIEWCLGRDVEFVPHNFGTWLGLVANAHLVAAAPEVRLLEYPVFENDPALDPAGADPGMYPFDLAFDVIEETVDVTDGELAVPDGPGLGVTVDLDVVEEYPPTDGPWTEFHYDE